MPSMSLFLSFAPLKEGLSPKPGRARGEGGHVTLPCPSYSEGRGPLSLAHG